MPTTQRRYGVTSQSEPDELFVRVRFIGDRPTLPEVIETLNALDRAWAISSRIALIDQRLRSADERAVRAGDDRAKRPGALVQPMLQLSDIEAMQAALDDLAPVHRPFVRLRKESPLIVELSDLVPHSREEVAATIVASWIVFRYVIGNAERIGGFPHRLRYGWHAARTDAENARFKSVAARKRRELDELERKRGEALETLGRDLRRAGPVEIESDIPDDPEALA
jgi:hypothetical protein